MPHDKRDVPDDSTVASTENVKRFRTQTMMVGMTTVYSSRIFTDLVNHFFRILSCAMLMAGHGKKTAKYTVKAHKGIIGSEYVSYYTVVAC